MKKILTAGVIGLIALLSVQAFSEEEAQEPTRLQMDARFYDDFIKTPAILRDDFFKKRLNTLVLGRGRITAITRVPGFKKNFRIDMTEEETERLNIRIIYRVHVDSRQTISMLKEQERLEFTGQLIGYTPVTSKRNAYILDILMEKGAMLIE